MENENHFGNWILFHFEERLWRIIHNKTIHQFVDFKLILNNINTEKMIHWIFKVSGCNQFILATFK